MSSTTYQGTNNLEVISTAFWKAAGRRERSLSPLPAMQRLRSHTFKVADLVFLFPYVWVILCVAIAQCCQERTFPYLSIITIALVYTSSLAIPLVRQFISPATPILLYLWTVAYFSRIPSMPISIPLHLTIITHPVLASCLWLFGPMHAVQFQARLVGYANLAVLALFILPYFTFAPRVSPGTPPVSSHLGYQGTFAGLNTGLQMFALAHFIPEYEYGWVGILFGICCALVGLSRDFLGFALGFCAATSFFFFIPEELLGNVPSEKQDFPSSSPPVVDGTEKQEAELQFPISLPGVISPTDSDSSILLPPRLRADALVSPAIPQAAKVVHTANLPAASGANDSRMRNPTPPIPGGTSRRTSFLALPAVQKSRPTTPTPPNGDTGTEEADPDAPTASVRKRSSVLGPRKPREPPGRQRPSSVDISPGNNPPTKVLPSPPLIPPTLAPPSVRFPPPPIETRPDHSNSFEVISCLGKSSSRASYQVRDKHSRELRVQKTFFPRQTNSRHIMNELIALANIQKNHNTSPNVLRCFAAYNIQGQDDVEAIFEYCEGGSLWSIGRAVAQRKKAVGERIAGRLSEGILRGLAYLHGLDIAHRNIKPSNILLTRSGVVKLSEPEISGEGPTNLTDSALTSLVYASPERFQPTATNDRRRSDIWSMGITLLEFVQNECPFPSNLPAQLLMVRIVSENPPQLRDNGQLKRTAEMKDFFRQLLIANPDVRPSSRDLLRHPWILNAVKQVNNGHMEKWINDVWGWTAK